MTNPPSRTDRLQAALQAAFAPVELQVIDDSARHAGHSGAQVNGRPGGQTHYNVLVVADGFRGQTRVARQRRVHEVLAAEFEGGLHALSLVLRTPEEHAAMP